MSKPYGVVFSNKEIEICHTAYEFETVELAIAAGRRVMEWFKNKAAGQPDPYDEVGVSIDWTTDDESAIPIGFYVDNEDQDYLEWVEEGNDAQV